MNIPELKLEIAIPQGVTFSVKDGLCNFKGPKGENSRNLFNPLINISAEGSNVVVVCKNASKREKTIFFTIVSHLKNLLSGVEKGFTYKLKVCSGHFPMAVAIKGDVLEVKNFIGEAVPRRLKLNSKVKVAIEGQIITVEGIDVEATGQQASMIELLTRRVGFDRRVFQDGIYITEKGE